MNATLAHIAHSISVSPLHQGAMFLLSKIPGFPPVIQTVHILGIAVVMGSVVLVDLRVLGLALPSHRVGELANRVLPWTWWALLALAVSGLTLVFARPNRYFVNPVFGIKFALLVPALLLTLWFYLRSRRSPDFWEQTSARKSGAKLLAFCSLLLWLGVVMAGRWIAYADYLFGEP